jgi:hypothetical protein
VKDSRSKVSMMYHIVGDGYWIFEQTLPKIPQTKKKTGNEMSSAIILNQ